MIPWEDRAPGRPAASFLRIIQLLDHYPDCLTAGADNVGSEHVPQVLASPLARLMGKNTMTHRAIQGRLENNPALEKPLPHLRGNVSCVFTKEDLP